MEVAEKKREKKCCIVNLPWVFWVDIIAKKLTVRSFLALCTTCKKMQKVFTNEHEIWAVIGPKEFKTKQDHLIEISWRKSLLMLVRPSMEIKIADLIIYSLSNYF